MSRRSATSDRTSERVQEHFQSAASSFDDLYTREHGESWLQRRLRPGLFLRAEAAVGLVRTYDNPRVLDVGCGSGRVGERVLDAGAGDYVGVDFSPPMIDLARKRLARFDSKVRLMSGDFLDADLDGDFDVVLALGFFDYLEEPLSFLRRMRELTAEGGTVLGSFPRWTWIKGPIRKVRYEWVNDVPIFNYTEDQLRELFSEAGLGRAEIDPFVRGGYLVRARRS
jgi:SAM-dependent methyltransferase